MMEFKYVFVTWLLWSAVTVDAKCPTDEELAAYAKRATKTNWAEKAKNAIAVGSAVAVGAGAIATAATAGAAGVVMAPLVGGLVAIGGLITAGINIFGPKDKPEPGQPIIICEPPNPEIHEIKEFVEQLNPMIHNLSNMVNERFDDVQKQISEAVGEIIHAIGEAEAAPFRANWAQNVVAPMNILRQDARDLTAYSIANMSSALTRAAADSMAKHCSVPQFDPYVILNHIWSQFGEGCRKGAEKTTTLKGPYCDPHSPKFVSTCIVLENKCYAEMVIRNSGHNHSTATYLTNLVMGTVLELTTYQAICSNYTHQNDADIEYSNNQFRRLVNDTLTQMQEIIINETERYWKEPAEKYLRQLMEGPGDLEKAEKAQKALNERYFWYEHQVFVMRAYASHSESTLQDGGFIFIFDHAQQYNIDGFLMVSRYRQTSDAEKADVRARYQNYLKWLKTPVPHEAKCYVEGHSDTVEGCIARASGDFEYLAILLLTIKLALTTVLLERIAILHPECANLAPPTTPFTHRNTSGGTDTGTDTSTVTSEPADAPIMAINLLLMTTSLIVMIF